MSATETAAAAALLARALALAAAPAAASADPLRDALAGAARSVTASTSARFHAIHVTSTPQSVVDLWLGRARAGSRALTHLCASLATALEAETPERPIEITVVMPSQHDCQYFLATLVSALMGHGAARVQRLSAETVWTRALHVHTVAAGVAGARDETCQLRGFDADLLFIDRLDACNLSMIERVVRPIFQNNVGVIALVDSAVKRETSCVRAVMDGCGADAEFCCSAVHVDS